MYCKPSVLFSLEILLHYFPCFVYHVDIGRELRTLNVVTISCRWSKCWFYINDYTYITQSRCLPLLWHGEKNICTKDMSRGSQEGVSNEPPLSIIPVRSKVVCCHDKMHLRRQLIPTQLLGFQTRSPPSPESSTWQLCLMRLSWCTPLAARISPHVKLHCHSAADRSLESATTMLTWALKAEEQWQGFYYQTYQTGVCA